MELTTQSKLADLYQKLANEEKQKVAALQSVSAHCCVLLVLCWWMVSSCLLDGCLVGYVFMYVFIFVLIDP